MTTGMNWSIESIFQIVQTAALLLGVPVIAFRLGRGTEAVRASITAQGLTVAAIVEELKEIKGEQKEFRTVLTQVALQSQRLDNQGAQIAVLLKTVDDMRRGEGFILPLDRHREIPSGG